MTDRLRTLTAQGLTLGYGDRTVLRDLDLIVPPGQFTALLGPNGSGKSTLLRALAKLHPLAQGGVYLDGKNIDQSTSKQVAREISLLPQSAVAPEGLTVSDLVRQGRYPHRSMFGGWTAEDDAAVGDALSMTALLPFRDRSLHALSGGQRQRVWIAMALAQKAPVLLLDEPTTFLDLAHQLDLMELVLRLVRDGSMTVVAVLHDLNQAARYCDHLVFLKDGHILHEGSVNDVFTAEVIAQTYGVETDVLNDRRTGRPYCLPFGRAP